MLVHTDDAVTAEAAVGVMVYEAGVEVLVEVTQFLLQGLKQKILYLV